LDTDFKEGLYVGYKWYDEHGIEPLFPFRHGLSYTTFNLLDLHLSSVNTSTTATVVANMELFNVGLVTGKQVVQLYVSYPAAAMEPPKLLKGFEKVFLEAGKETDVAIMIEKSDLRIWDERTEYWSLVTGDSTFLVGFSAGDIILQKSVYVS
jgi:beta-glucosidase